MRKRFPNDQPPICRASYFCSMKNSYFFFILFMLVALLLSFASQPLQKSEQLGERLFSDPILSLDSTISCASCHIPAFAFADTAVFSRGVGGRKGKRNAPGITNMTARAHFFYDGRAATLEQQVLMPIQDTLEMRLTLDVAIQRLRRHPVYAGSFRQVFGREADASALALVLADFVRTLETPDTPFDRWMMGKNNPMNEAAVRGREVFMKKGKCFDCHFSPDFTGDEFRNVGLYTGQGHLADRGRFEVSRDSADLGRFKVPGLRNVALTAPYMHNGMFKTLDEVIEYYDTPDRLIPGSINRDTLLKAPLQLTQTEKSDLKAFLIALTDDRFKI